MKRDILYQANYRYNFDRDIYVNPTVKKAFSLAFVDDHDEKELMSRIQETTSGEKWKFYFNAEPSEGVKRALESILG